MKIFNPKTKDDWLSLRAQDITATEASALFGVNPYTTEHQLWHEKKSGAINEVEETERMTWGKRLERVIAEGICEDNGWELTDEFPYGSYFRHSESQMGATPDFAIVCPERGKGILEIKNVDWLQHKRNWDEDEAPPHIEIQLQQQLHIAKPAGFTWGAIGYLKGGNEAQVHIREYDADMCDAIQDKINLFWKSIENNVEPKPDYSKDAAYLIKKYGFDDGTEVDMQDNDRLPVLCEAYQSLNAKAIQAKKNLEAMKAEMFEALGTNTAAFVHGYKLTGKRSKDSIGTLITQDMVGTYIGARKGSRRLNIKETME